MCLTWPTTRWRGEVSVLHRVYSLLRTDLFQRLQAVENDACVPGCRVRDGVAGQLRLECFS